MEDTSPDRTCALGRRIAVWESPKFPDYNKHSILATFDKWPHGMTPSPTSLVRAGFYFTGKEWFLLFYYFVLRGNEWSSCLIPLFLFYVTAYRCVWSDGLFPLWGRIGALGGHGWRICGTRVLFSILCLCQIHKGGRVCSRMSTQDVIHKERTRLCFYVILSVG